MPIKPLFTVHLSYIQYVSPLVTIMTKLFTIWNEIRKLLSQDVKGRATCGQDFKGYDLQSLNFSSSLAE